jgi:hypothetical protein
MKTGYDENYIENGFEYPMPRLTATIAIALKKETLPDHIYLDYKYYSVVVNTITTQPIFTATKNSSKKTTVKESGDQIPELVGKISSIMIIIKKQLGQRPYDYALEYLHEVLMTMARKMLMTSLFTIPLTR